MSSHLVRIAEGLYGVDTVLTLQGNWLFPARMTLWRDSEGGVVLHSPIALGDAFTLLPAETGFGAALALPTRLSSASFFTRRSFSAAISWATTRS